MVAGRLAVITDKGTTFSGNETYGDDNSGGKQEEYPCGDCRGKAGEMSVRPAVYRRMESAEDGAGGIKQGEKWGGGQSDWQSVAVRMTEE